MAKQAMQDAVKAAPTSATVQYTCGLAYLEDRSFGEAENALNLAVRLSPNWHDPSLALVKVLARTGRQGEAFRRLDDLKTKFQTEPRIREALGSMHIDANDFNSARKEFKELLDIDAGSDIGKNGLGLVLLSTGQFREAAEIFGELAGRNLRGLTFRTNQARALSRMQNKEELLTAQKICEEVLQFDHVRSEALACLGVTHYKLGSWNQSEENLKRAIELSPADGPYRDLGALYTKQGRYEEAEDKLKMAIQMSKFDTRSYIELGSLYFEMDRKTNALGMLRRAVATDRNSVEATQALTKGLIQLKEFSEAERQLRDGIKRLNPRDCFGLHLLLARLLTQVGSKANDTILLEEALQQASRAVKLDPNNPDGYFELGMAHNALNSPNRALRNFKECLDRVPDHLEAQRNIERLKKLLSMERTARRSDAAGIAISITSFLLLLVLWGLYLHQPVLPLATGNVAAVPELTAAKAKAVAKAAKAVEALAKPDDGKPGREPSNELKIDKLMMLTFTPLLLGLIVIGAVLPWLARLKLPGLEAELQQARMSIGGGPSGQTRSGSPEGAVVLSASGGDSIDTGPR